jgi:hypothetical protein
MKKEGTIGTAAFLAIAAAVGVTLHLGSNSDSGGRAESGTPPKRTPHTSSRPASAELKPGCLSIQQQFQDFLNADVAIAPSGCYGTPLSGGKEIPKIPTEITEKTSKLRFVIATLPDPLHTHLALLFDQFAAAIQDAAQDEQYDFDSSWLPWDDEAESYTLLVDQEIADSRKDEREKQPGILLFRNAAPPQEKRDEGLVVFVVGEEATHGIHNGQFQNALVWADALVPDPDERRKRLAILGPTFSGSLPSLSQLLWDSPEFKGNSPLDVFSGSVSSEAGAKNFQDDHSKDDDTKTDDRPVVFHSFVRSDEEMLKRFCTYMKWDKPDTEGFDKPGAERFAILSEDETAYGKRGAGKDSDSSAQNSTSKGDTQPPCTDRALKLFYPRDISALRGAYQSKSIFGLQAGSQPDSQRSLPTDLADPAGKVHDSIRSYGGNQTPLEQEALLLEIVAALRDLHARYILLRGSNPLDQLFLANFLRRMYPSGRIVILFSDLLFVRERGATGLNGAITLTNYPLFPLARDWTEHANQPAADREFTSDTAEGTYIAFRVLLGSSGFSPGPPDPSRCHLADESSEGIFVPEVVCDGDPVPDYSLPYWMGPENCREDKNSSLCYPGPATWLNVIGVNRFWPIASLTDHPNSVADLSLPQNRSDEPGRILTMPPSMKILFAVLIAFALFHAWCCWRGSYTAKPNFLAHFASAGDWRHAVLVHFGSSLLAFIGIVAAWGCGAFFRPAYFFARPLPALVCAVIVCLIAWLSIIGRIVTVWRLKVARQRVLPKEPQKSTPRESWINVFLPRKWSQRQMELPSATQPTKGQKRTPRKSWIKVFLRRKGSQVLRASLIFLAVLAFFGLQIQLWEQDWEKGERALTYWRAMNLTSGVSPIVPQIVLLAGLYVWFWLALHGLALFGLDRPRLPSLEDLKLKVKDKEYDFLRMFSQEVTAKKIEDAGETLAAKMMVLTVALFALFLVAAFTLNDGLFLRGLGAQFSALILMLWFFASVSLQLAEAWRLCELWQELRGLLGFLDRLALRRTMAVMRGISWANVWKMGGNVLEVRYKVISRQMESMNHSIAGLQEFWKTPQDPTEAQAALYCLRRLEAVRTAGFSFADWYSSAYTERNAGDLTKFSTFQETVAIATGALLTHLLIPAWRKEEQSLILAPTADKEGATASTPPPAKEEHVKNAEEFVCLTYLGFIQNILGRLRTLAMTIMILFFATTISLSVYPFDPRQVLSAILIVLFIVLGVAVVKVYVEMHRDATLSYVTNTKPGELDSEFWFKVLGFGLAPLAGLLTRIFPDISDFIFAWVQPSISSLK